jgi:competence protein ComGF
MQGYLVMAIIIVVLLLTCAILVMALIIQADRITIERMRTGEGYITITQQELELRQSMRVQQEQETLLYKVSGARTVKEYVQIMREVNAWTEKQQKPY